MPSQIESYEEFHRFTDQGWSEWLPFCTEALADRRVHYPGVYEVAGPQPFPRLKGESPTLYIGASEKHDIGHRIKAHLKGDRAGKRLLRVRDELGWDLRVRVKVTTSAEATERQLLMQYQQTHLELPPCNRNGGKNSRGD
jgi:hypothetical protein